MNGEGRLELFVVGRVDGIGDLEACGESLEGFVSSDPPVVMLEKRKEGEEKGETRRQFSNQEPDGGGSFLRSSSLELTMGSLAEAKT